MDCNDTHTCKHCLKTFQKKHIWRRHQDKHCPKKSISPPTHNHDAQIKQAEKLVKNFKNNHQDTSQAIQLNKSMILLKNTYTNFQLKCKYCNLAFLFHTDLLIHQQNCPHLHQFNDTPHNNTIQLNDILIEIDNLKNIIHDMHTQLIQLKNVLPLLQELQEIKFHLKMFKLLALK